MRVLLIPLHTIKSHEYLQNGVRRHMYEGCMSAVTLRKTSKSFDLPSELVGGVVQLAVGEPGGIRGLTQGGS